MQTPRPPLAPGSPFPDCELTDHSGNRRTLSELAAGDPEVSAALRAGLGARWTFLSDADRSVRARLGLRESTDKDLVLV